MSTQYNTCPRCASSGVGACDDFPDCQKHITPSGDERGTTELDEFLIRTRPLAGRTLPDVAAFSDVVDELGRARVLFSSFASAHEGYAVILEELDELWTEVKDNKSREYKARMRKEAVQVAAMAVRFMIDCCEELCRRNLPCSFR